MSLTVPAEQKDSASQQHLDQDTVQHINPHDVLLTHQMGSLVSAAPDSTGHVHVKYPATTRPPEPSRDAAATCSAGEYA